MKCNVFQKNTWSRSVFRNVFQENRGSWGRLSGKHMVPEHLSGHLYEKPGGVLQTKIEGPRASVRNVFQDSRGSWGHLSGNHMVPEHLAGRRSRKWKGPGPSPIGVYISACQKSVQWQLGAHVTWTHASCKQSPEAVTFDLLFVRTPHVHGAGTRSISFALWPDFSHEGHMIQ